jgi:hypothetical protein
VHDQRNLWRLRRHRDHDLLDEQPHEPLFELDVRRGMAPHGREVVRQRQQLLTIDGRSRRARPSAATAANRCSTSVTRSRAAFRLSWTSDPLLAAYFAAGSPEAGRRIVRAPLDAAEVLVFLKHAGARHQPEARRGRWGRMNF